jgi:hypothetical protein
VATAWIFKIIIKNKYGDSIEASKTVVLDLCGRQQQFLKFLLDFCQGQFPALFDLL